MTIIKNAVLAIILCAAPLVMGMYVNKNVYISQPERL